ncbi:hypothetical protein GUJ93_ZPchr0010g10411 [Zizania palustris]|uniref:Uncharacterized protein n=1 Tax=Zizania palustris TaxID=103762 RepID=A0A8J5WEF9_ZIZPA|nr:hypothetical protein GUJ93_ZPchr0010g10411 [Zizania palustris]
MVSEDVGVGALVLVSALDVGSLGLTPNADVVTSIPGVGFSGPTNTPTIAALVTTPTDAPTSVGLESEDAVAPLGPNDVFHVDEF